MAARYVRNLMDTWAQALNTPYYSTINVEQNPTDPQWMTLEYDYAQADVLDYCGNVIHYGVLSLVFFGQAGIGDDALLQAAETDLGLMMLNDDPNQKLVLYSHEAPEDFVIDGDVPFFGISCRINYEYTE